MTLALADVRDPDCVVSLRPLRFDLPVPHREAVGAAAILRRWLYRVCLPRGAVRGDATIGIEMPLCDLEGARYDGRALLLLRSRLTEQAKAMDYVDDAIVSVSAAGGVLAVRVSLQLVDGRTYQLELQRGADAAVTLLSLGGAP